MIDCKNNVAIRIMGRQGSVGDSGEAGRESEEEERERVGDSGKAWRKELGSINAK